MYPTFTRQPYLICTLCPPIKVIKQKTNKIVFLETFTSKKILPATLISFLLTGDDDEEEEEGEDGAEKEEKMPTCGDYIMHFLTLFWKVIFSFIPPAGKYLSTKFPLC